MKNEDPWDEDILQERLYILQNEAYEKGVSFYIILEGWAQTGKGNLLKKLTYRMDPKKLKVYSPIDTESWDSKFPFQYKYWWHFPPRGITFILLKSWYYRASFGVWSKNVSKDELPSVHRSILNLEKTLAEDGIVILKFFLDITKEELVKRIKKAEKEGKSWEASDVDKAQVKDYETFRDYFNDYKNLTDQPYAPWISVSAMDMDKVDVDFMKALVLAMEKKLTIDSWEVMKTLAMEGE